MARSGGGLSFTYHRYQDWARTRAGLLSTALRTYSIHPAGDVRGNVLVSWMSEAFAQPIERLGTNHTNLWECRQVVQTFLDLGYRVDVINFRNVLHRPKREYRYFIDNRLNMERLAEALGDDCTRIMHIENSHMTHQNAMEWQRLADIQRRRGVTLQPRRVQRRLNLCIEHADLATYYGNDTTAATFAFAGKPLHRLPLSTVQTFPSPATRDIAGARYRFLWMGSGGLALKGLDLALEAFAGMPDCELIVCGNIAAEADFAAAFRPELQDASNITATGWVDVTSPAFRALTDRCIGMVYPSASEGQSGAVVTAMHAGLIPVVTPQSGVDGPAGVVERIGALTVDAVQESVQAVLGRSDAELRAGIEASWRHANAFHTRGAFADAYRSFVAGLEHDAA